MSEKKKRYLEKTIAEELEVIREADKKEISKSEMAQVYGIPVSPLLM
jgi:predicted DNA-binding protein (UPF0251 family)